MANKNDYFSSRNEITNDKIEFLLAELPCFTADFFYGISNNTSALTRLNYAYDLRIFFNYLSQVKKIPVEKMQVTILDELRAVDIERFLNYLSHYKLNGRNLSCNERGKARKLATIRAMYRYYFSRDMIKANVAAKIETPKLHEKEIIRLEDDEVERLLDYAESDDAYSGRKQSFHTKLKTRDFAILSLFLGTGIRISELVGLDVDHIFFDTNSFIVTRKGGNRTILYFTDEVRYALLNWMEYRAEIKHLDKNEKALFLSLRNKRISVRTVQILVEKYAKVVSPLKKITPHKLRSTFGTVLYRQTGDIYVVADFLGHRDVNTTKKHYAAMSDDIRKKAIKKIKLHDDEE